MNPNVDLVNILSVRELADIPVGSVTPSWYTLFCDPTTGISYKGTWAAAADVISQLIGSGVIEPDRTYIGGQPGPIDPATGDPVDVPTDGDTVIDTYLDGKVYSLELRGVGFLQKGVEWDNDVPGGGWRLLGGAAIYADALYTAHFHPQISNIIASPDAIAKFTAGVQIINSNTTITAGMFRKLLVLTDGYQVTLAVNYPENILCAFTVNAPSNRQSTIIAPVGQTIAFNGGNVQQIWLGKNEDVSMVRAGNTWYILPGSTMSVGYRLAGTIDIGRLAGPNQIIAQGQLLLRSEHPRILDYITRLNAAYPGTVLSASDWSGNRTFWGFGDGSTTIQVPDLRGYFPRWLDLGAGIDADRVASGLQNKGGSGQGMKVEEHNHLPPNAKFNKLVASANEPDGEGGHFTAAIFGGTYNDGRPKVNATGQLQPYGGSETRPINVGELPLLNL